MREDIVCFGWFGLVDGVFDFVIEGVSWDGWIDVGS